MGLTAFSNDGRTVAEVEPPADAPLTVPARAPYPRPGDGAGLTPCLGPVSGLDLVGVLAALLEHHPDLDQLGLDRVVAAFDIADVGHAGQTRTSGDAYIVHPLAVAVEVANLGMDADTVAAALCHDLVEDTAVDVDTLAAVIGDTAARLVDGVTKLDAVADASKSERVAGSLRKLLVAATGDIRVLVIKLADRLHNMRTLDALRPEKRARIASETLEVYAPLAHRLGMSEIKAELEDVAFAVLEPEKSAEISTLIDERAPSSTSRVEQAVEQATTALAAAGLTATVTGRKKHVYSAYRKMVVRQVPFAEIADLIGLRVIVSTPAECYAALGVLHAAFTPVPARFRDYIALPKWGQYRSLHTTVVDADGITFEVQVRSWEMHAQAEFGVAAHWKYKANPARAHLGHGGSLPLPAVGDLPWLSDLLTSGAAEVDPEEFLACLRRDLGVGEVVALTPRGDVVPLPSGATALDFAYHVHTEVGHRALAAHVNGRLRPLSVQLAPGDRVEIVTGDQPGVCKEWLQVVTTGRAAHSIRSMLSARHREDLLAAGQEELVRACRDVGVPPSWEMSVDPSAVAAAFGYADPAALYAAVGDGHLPAARVAARIRTEASEASMPLSPVVSSVPAAGTHTGTTSDGQPLTLDQLPAGAYVDGFDDVLLERAHCCQVSADGPKIGIVVAPGRVLVHRSDCLTAATQHRQARTAVDVALPADVTFHVAFSVSAIDRRGLLKEICATLDRSAAELIEVHAVTGRDRVARVELKLVPADEGHAHRVEADLRRVDGVYRVTRDR